MIPGVLLAALVYATQSPAAATVETQTQAASVEERLEAVRKAPIDPEVHLDLGLAYQEAGDIDFAMSEFIEAIRLSPENTDNVAARGNFHLGMILMMLDRAGLAAGAYREALRLGWRTAPVYTALGQALSGLGKHAEAIAQYQEALRLAPESFEAHAGLAWALEATHRDAEAISSYESALRLAAEAQDHAVEVLEDRLRKLKARQQM
jgi:tetratricopeptide (TPR) repeat protein